VKKQKKKFKNKKNLKINNIDRLIKEEPKECQHFHFNNDGSCCHCGKNNYIFKLFK
jgi:hypothetical protein